MRNFFAKLFGDSANNKKMNFVADSYKADDNVIDSVFSASNGEVKSTKKMNFVADSYNSNNGVATNGFFNFFGSDNDTFNDLDFSGCYKLSDQAFGSRDF